MKTRSWPLPPPPSQTDDDTLTCTGQAHTGIWHKVTEKRRVRLQTLFSPEQPPHPCPFPPGDAVAHDRAGTQATAAQPVGLVSGDADPTTGRSVEAP